jgi:hypothetical protein
MIHRGNALFLATSSCFGIVAGYGEFGPGSNDYRMLNQVSWLLGQPETQSRYRSPVRILLQHARTQLYLRSLGNWTMNPLEAFDFQHSQRAVDFARQNDLAGVQIAIKFIDGQYDEVFPLPPLTPTASTHTHS